MAIDRMRKAWLVCPAAAAAALPGHLAKMGLVHVARVEAADPAHAAAVTRLSADTRDVEARMRALAEIVDVLGEFSQRPGDLLSGLIPTPVETTRAELAAALAAIDVDALHREAKGAAGRRAAARAAVEQATERLKTIGGFASYTVTMPAPASLRWTHASLWLIPAKQAGQALERGGLVSDLSALEPLGTLDGRTLVASVCLKGHEDDVASSLRVHGFEQIPAPSETTTVDAYVEAIEAERRRNYEIIDAANGELAELGRQRHQAELVLGHCEEQRETALALGKMAVAGRAAVLMGYVRARDERRLREVIWRDVPQATLVVEDPEADDDVPVALRCSKLVRPASFLVEMFGLPAYTQFDPSAFLMASFVLFFGICLGDAIYGILLFAACWALVRRYRDYPVIRSLFELLAWGAVSTFVVGVLTGTWAADLFLKYLGGETRHVAVTARAAADSGATPEAAAQVDGEPGAEQEVSYNAFGGLVKSLRGLDPLDKPLLALGIALFLGVANQFWGVAMKIYSCLRQGDRWGALFDGGFWLILLPGAVMLIAVFFSPELPGWVSRVGVALALVGAVGLVLSQGRNEDSLVGKIVVGLVSLYGIVGSYGVVTFIGDTLSYSRLLALGLTTAIVGSAVNIVADMLKVDIFLLGILLFVVVAIVGHVFNLLISGLGAFIHSARLIFVEFFGRFYEPGAQRFAPLGATGGRIRVTD